MASFKGSAAGMLSQGVTSWRDGVQLPCPGCKEAFSSFIDCGQRRWALVQEDYKSFQRFHVLIHDQACLVKYFFEDCSD